MNDQDFIQRCFRRDNVVWNEFIRRYSRLIYSCIYSVFRIKGIRLSLETANDLFQEILLHLIADDFRRMRQFKGKNKASFASWLRVIIINFCLRYAYNESRCILLSLDENPAIDRLFAKRIFLDRNTSAREFLINHEKLQLLYHCIETLSYRDKYFLEMHIYRGMKLAALQVSLNISRSAVDMRKLRLIRRLKNCFRHNGAELGC